jgi:hypothetical protein
VLLGNRRYLGSALLLLAVLGCGVAHADATAPDAGETCTLDAQKHPGEECLVCTAWQGDSAKCLKRLSSKGYERRCRGAGTSTWSEVWCRAGRSGGEAKPSPP